MHGVVLSAQGVVRCEVRVLLCSHRVREARAQVLYSTADPKIVARWPPTPKRWATLLQSKLQAGKGVQQHQYDLPELVASLLASLIVGRQYLSIGRSAQSAPNERGDSDRKLLASAEQLFAPTW
jgi:hypothetical protein